MGKNNENKAWKFNILFCYFQTGQTGLRLFVVACTHSNKFLGNTFPDWQSLHR